MPLRGDEFSGFLYHGLVLEERFCHSSGLFSVSAAEHSDEFLDTCFTCDFVELGCGSAFFDVFFYYEVLAGYCCYLWEVGDGDDLVMDA